jgi:signal recognition particle GTPase
MRTAGKVTTKKALKAELDRMRKMSTKAIDNTADEARTFWVGFDQAVQNLQQRFPI